MHPVLNRDPQYESEIAGGPIRDLLANPISPSNGGRVRISYPNQHVHQITKGLRPVEYEVWKHSHQCPRVVTIVKTILYLPLKKCLKVTIRSSRTQRDEKCAQTRISGNDRTGIHSTLPSSIKRQSDWRAGSRFQYHHSSATAEIIDQRIAARLLSGPLALRKQTPCRQAQDAKGRSSLNIQFFSTDF